MKLRRILLSGFLSLVLLFSAPFGASAQNGPPGDRVPDHYLILLEANSSPAWVAARHGLSPRFAYQTAVNGFSAFVPPGKLRQLQRDRNVTSIIPDRFISAYAKPVKGGNPGGNSQVLPLGVQRIGAAPGSLPFAGNGIGVAVLDTGIDFNHADLQPLGSHSYSAFGDSAQDGNGHGTHVAGIIAARHNQGGVVGVAPHATLYAVKVLDDAGSGSDGSVLAGLEWIAANAGAVSPPIRVINMSLGRPGHLNDNPALRNAVKAVYQAGITVVVAAGNDPALEVIQQVPATYPEVLAVASSTAVDGKANRWGQMIRADTASYFTSDGAFNSSGIGVTISAPGEDKEDVSNSRSITSVGILSTQLGGGTVRMSGTSMAAPHVAGVAALLYEAGGQSMTPESIRTRVRQSSRVQSAPFDSPTSVYTFDGVREGILYAPAALGQ